LDVKDIVDLSIKGVTATLAVVGAAVALWNVRITVRTKTAEFLLSLHKAFFTEKTYDDMRRFLDDQGEIAVKELALKVHNEDDDFIRFLNFFELIAYMWACHTLQYEDVEALLGYYLRRLNHNEEVRKYISNPEKSFEHLNRLLKKIAL